MRGHTICFALLLLVVAAAPTARAANLNDCFQATMVQDKGLKSIELCGKLIKAGRLNNKDMAIALNNRGLGYVKQDKLDLAMVDLERAVRLDRTYAYAFDNMGDVWVKRGDYDKAIVQYNHAIRVDPTFLSAYLDRAGAYEKLGKMESARADYQTVIDLKGQDRAIDRWAKDRAREHLQRLGKKS
ncbi:MAG TPA: tetratricopeptide repeat protein [Pseudolabrys sp.]|nr:tetratricopeptide repeat protein [Pseudolabrys sp.]